MVPGAAGSPPDALARIIGEPLAALGQPVVVDNRPGGIGTLALGASRRPHPTAIRWASSACRNWSHRALLREMPYDTARDLAPVTQLVWTANVARRAPGVAAATVADLVALAKAKPRRVDAMPPQATARLRTWRWSCSGISAGIDVQHVPFKGIPAGLAALMGEQVDFAFAGVADGVAAGPDRASCARSAPRAARACPRCPTCRRSRSSAFTDYQLNEWYGVVAPAGTPPRSDRRARRASWRAVVALPRDAGAPEHAWPVSRRPARSRGAGRAHPGEAAALAADRARHAASAPSESAVPIRSMSTLRQRSTPSRPIRPSRRSWPRARPPGTPLSSCRICVRACICSTWVAAPDPSRSAWPSVVAPGRVVGIDIQSAQVEQARARAAARGMATARFEVADLYRLPFPDGLVRRGLRERGPDASARAGARAGGAAPRAAARRHRRHARSGFRHGSPCSHDAAARAVARPARAGQAAQRRRSVPEPPLSPPAARGRLRASRRQRVRRQCGDAGGNPPPRRFPQSPACRALPERRWHRAGWIGRRWTRRRPTSTHGRSGPTRSLR